MSKRDIQVFISFANFYWRFIWGFSRITVLLTLMLKMTRLSNMAPRLWVNDNEVVGDAGKADDRNMSKKLNNIKSELKCVLELWENLHS